MSVGGRANGPTSAPGTPSCKRHTLPYTQEGSMGNWQSNVVLVQATARWSPSSEHWHPGKQANLRLGRARLLRRLRPTVGAARPR